MNAFGQNTFLLRVTSKGFADRLFETTGLNNNYFHDNIVVIFGCKTSVIDDIVKTLTENFFGKHINVLQSVLNNLFTKVYVRNFSKIFIIERTHVVHMINVIVFFISLNV